MKTLLAFFRCLFTGICGRPEVIVDFVFDNGLFYIALLNMGDRPAQDITVRFYPSFSGVGGQKSMPDMLLFRETAFLPPGKEIRTFLDNSNAYFARAEPTDITTHIRYRSASGRSYEAEIHHNLAIYRDIGYINSR